MTHLYRFRKENEQDRQHMESILQYCRIEYEHFLKKIEEKGGAECRK